MGITESIDAPQTKEPTHVDHFIDYGSNILSDDCPENEDYARWVFDYFRCSAICKWTFAPFMSEHKLFCDYKGKQYRVTGASGMGDVWLTTNFKQDTGYEKRVMVDDCSAWAKAPAANS